MNKQLHSLRTHGCNSLSVPLLQLISVSKMGPRDLYCGSCLCVCVLGGGGGGGGVVDKQQGYVKLTHLLHKSHHAQVQFPTMHHAVTELCTKWCTLGILPMHCKISEMGPRRRRNLINVLWHTYMPVNFFYIIIVFLLLFSYMGDCFWRSCALFNSLTPKRNRRHFAGDIFKCIFLK